MVPVGQIREMYDVFIFLDYGEFVYNPHGIIDLDASMEGGADILLGVVEDSDEENVTTYMWVYEEVLDMLDGRNTPYTVEDIRRLLLLEAQDCWSDEEDRYLFEDCTWLLKQCNLKTIFNKVVIKGEEYV